MRVLFFFFGGCFFFLRLVLELIMTGVEGGQSSLFFVLLIAIAECVSCAGWLHKNGTLSRNTKQQCAVEKERSTRVCVSWRERERG